MIRKLLIITCLLSTVFVAFGQKKKKAKKDEENSTTSVPAVDYKVVGAPMPAIRGYIVNGKVVTNKLITEKDVENDANLFVMMFNPLCDHCQEVTSEIGEHIDLFKNSNILLLATPNMGDYMEFFENSTKVSKYPKIQIALDSADFIGKAYTYTALPQINIYNKERKLIKMFTGGAPIDSLKQFIE